MLKKFFITLLLSVLFLIPASTIIAQTKTVTSSKAPPMIFDISPSNGPPAGGTEVTIFGSNFTGTTAVMFGSNAATGVTVDSDDQITATTPAGTGMVDVTVTTAEGISNPFTFFYHPPFVDVITPSDGPCAGGTLVEISGINLTGATEVYFGSNAATGVIADSDTLVTAISPQGSGRVDVTVIAAGQSSNPIDFYYHAPVIFDISPSDGPPAGGTSVVIIGSNLTGAEEVMFGSNAATGFTVDSDDQITAVTPSGTGMVDVTVASAGGISAPSNFFYQPPMIGMISPSNGPTYGGISVTVTGNNFTGAEEVMFGSNAATGFTVDSDDQITAITPSGSGIVDVTVISAGQSSNTNQFTYYVAPAIPINVVISNDGSDVTVSWDEVTGATSYNVYSSTDPYSGFVLNDTGSFNDTSWTAPNSGNKLFYYVVAVD